VTVVTAIVKNQNGLHARPASMFIKKAMSFKCHVTVLKKDRKVNGKSITGILSLDIKAGNEITITTEGEDEVNASKVLKGFLEEFQEE
jgi:phosphocarrier protein HPr